tara:strand:- start:3571 stop:4413 length:843 start_codon:yes stop_codon:yes gene_type:complete
MKLLRQIIRNLILEEYELTDEDVAGIQKHGRFMFNNGQFDKNWPEVRIRKHWDERGEGLQGTEPIKRDVNAMKEFNKMMHASSEGKQIIKDFQSGRIQVLHSIEYQGLLSRKKEIQTSAKPFTLWLDRFGRKGKDMVSVVASPMAYDESPKIENWPEHWNAGFVYEDGYGFLMKGYPAFIGNEDLMSQTLSAVPQTLKDFQKNSGVAKRASDADWAVDLGDWGNGIGSEETLLDNWTVIGVYIGSAHSKGTDKYNQLLKDAQTTGLPVYHVKPDKSLEKV